MTPEEYERAGRIFREARSLGEDERAAFLDRACGDDAALRAAVEAWLAADESTGELGVARADARADAAELPDRIGEFEVLGLLGRGGMGRVYLARQRTPARRVALKTLDPETPLSRTSIARFEAEAEYLARLHHDGIAQVYATGREETEHGRLPYLVMEWVEDGRALTAYAEAAGLGLEERLSLFLQLCDAVTHAHRRGVLHRDLKPSNVLVTPDGRLKVLDFGVARALEPAAAAAGDLTRRGEAIGTLPYMSPEQAQGRTDEIDVRTDVYALGVILFELVAGRLPFALPADRYDAVDVISNELPPRLNAVRTDVPRDLAAVVDAALAKAKDRRYESVAAFADDVRCVVEGKPVSTRPVSTWERGVYLVRRRKATAAAVTFLVLGLVGTSSFGVRSWLLDREAFFSEKKAEASELKAEATEREKVALEVERVFDIGEARAREGNWTKAMEAYDEALRRGHPDPVAIRLAQVDALEGMGEVHEARRILDELAARPESELGAHRARVLLYRADRTKVPESRVVPFEDGHLIDEAIGLETLSAADMAYAMALRSRDAGQQIAFLEAALRIDSRHRRANEMIAPTLLLAGHPRDALRTANEFRRLYPHDPAAQTIQLGVRTILQAALPAHAKRDHPAVPDEVFVTLEQLARVVRFLRDAFEFLDHDLQAAVFETERTRGLKRMMAMKELVLLLASPHLQAGGSFEATFRVPPRLSETWFGALGRLAPTMLGGSGSSEALEFFSRSMERNDDAFLAYCAGIHRVLLDPDDPDNWRPFAAAASRESWLDPTKTSLIMVMVASLRRKPTAPPDEAVRAIERLFREFSHDELGFRLLWTAARTRGQRNLAGEVYHRWRASFPDDPALAEAEEWERTH